MTLIVIRDQEHIGNFISKSMVMTWRLKLSERLRSIHEAVEFALRFSKENNIVEFKKNGLIFKKRMVLMGVLRGKRYY